MKIKKTIEVPKTVLDTIEVIPVKNDEALKVALTKNLKRVEWLKSIKFQKKKN